MGRNISKVYVKVDERNRIIAIDGGYTVSNIKNFSGWILIDEGTGDKYNLCQGNYLDKPLMDERGIYRYKLDKTVYPDCIECDNGDELESEYIDYDIVERSAEEMDADYEETPPAPSQLDRVAAQVLYTALMTDTLIEEGDGNV